MVVYIDILLVINTVINYVILLSVDKLMKANVRVYRLLIGSLTGAIFSLAIYLDIANSFLLFGIKLLSSAVITLVTFGFHNKREYVKKMLLTVVLSLFYSGFFILFYQLFKPPNMLIVNDIVYFTFDPLVMIGLTVIIYLILLFVNKLFSERIKTSIVHLQFSVNDHQYQCFAKVDTGCNLCEPFSSSPVILADKTVFQIDSALPVRVIPYSTVGQTSCLYAVKADCVYIDKTMINKSIYIASVDKLNNDFHAIINSDIIR